MPAVQPSSLLGFLPLPWGNAKRSPYLKPNRLQDIVGALQIMGSSRRYKLPIEEWEKIIENKPLSDSSWEEVLKEHPEFFRKNNENQFSLIWRKGLPHVRDEDTRAPLDGNQIEVLLNTALNFHAKAI